jgi:hypothetical protein
MKRQSSVRGCGCPIVNAEGATPLFIVKTACKLTAERRLIGQAIRLFSARGILRRISALTYLRDPS